ncbi:MAG: hypothetical protein CL927_10755 [Deltaproteobacteria bacterium]|nr:hypothetical protein [Deltaproteobacteria bacterium]HCH65753.1 hypothetical protein [Deltaproteobacteria bacterium]
MSNHGIEGSTERRPVEIEVVRSAITRLSLLAQTLSGANEGDPERYASTFAEGLQVALAGNTAPIVLLVRDQAIFYAGSEVSGNDLVVRSIVQRIMEQGVSSITLLPGISRDELFELSNLLAKLETPTTATPTESRKRPVQTLDAAAWHLRLTHVHFEASAVEVREAGGAELRPVEVVRLLSQQLGLTEEALEPNTYIELSALLGGIRTLFDSSASTPFQTPNIEAQWGAVPGAVEHQDDVPNRLLGLLVTESLRAGVDDAEVTALSERWLLRVRDALAAGDPLLAGDLLRPLLLATDARFAPLGMALSAVRTATERFLGTATRDALMKGLRLHPQTDDWVGLMFTLGQIATADNILQLAEIGKELNGGPVREALGDGIALAIGRLDGVTMRDLLRRAGDDALRALLQAARREEDPTLIEPLLARIHHEDPGIREASLTALRAQQSPRIKAAARESIQDPAREVRMEALRYLSVYRDVDAALLVENRLREASTAEADLDELRALAIAWLHTSRGSAIAGLEALVAQDSERSHPELPAACIGALARAGAPGREALDRLGRSHERLRPLLRMHSEPRGLERRP